MHATSSTHYNVNDYIHPASFVVQNADESINHVIHLFEAW